VKVNFEFGALEIQLTKAQIEKWRQPLLNAFDGKMPCFELPKNSIVKKNAANMVDVSISACEISSTQTQSDTNSVGSRCYEILE